MNISNAPLVDKRTPEQIEKFEKDQEKIRRRYYKKAKERVRYLDKEFKGLSEDEVANARKSCGSNELEEVRKTPFISKLIKNLGDPIVRILIAAFFLTLILSGNDGSFTEAVGIAVSVIVSVLVSTLSEHGSEKAFRKMQAEATKVRCEVIRGGRVTEVYASELVVGDIVTVRAGDGIGADGELISGAVSVDMSVISGESAEVRVTPEGDKKSLYRGSTVTSGKGIMRVDAVGRNTFYGRIAGEVQTPSEESPLRDKLKKLAIVKAIFVVEEPTEDEIILNNKKK
jgi:magnesium-transporting ATPase (P-type)